MLILVWKVHNSVPVDSSDMTVTGRSWLDASEVSLNTYVINLVKSSSSLDALSIRKEHLQASVTC